MSPVRILIVDDELSLLRSLREAVLASKIEAEVLTASSGDEALQLLELAEVHLLVADRDMPNMDGIELITVVRGRWPEIRCALMVGKGDERAHVVARLAGATAVIDQPFEVGEFVDRLRELLPDEGFTGTQLTGFNLADLLQLVAMSGQQMTLRIERGERSGELSLAGGSLVHAVAGERSGLEAAREILAWNNGKVLSTVGVLPKAEWTVDVPVMELLVEAARCSDEDLRDDIGAELQATQASILVCDGVHATAVVVAESSAEAFGASATADFDRTLGVDMLLEMGAQLAKFPPDRQPKAFALLLADLRVTAFPVAGGKLLQVVWTSGAADGVDVAARVFEILPVLEEQLPKLLAVVEIDVGDEPDRGRFEIVSA